MIDNKTVKVDTKPIEQSVVENAEPERVIQTIMSEEDSYIADRMKSLPKTIDEVMLIKERHYKPGEHRLTLPKEFKEYEDRVTFRWINKKKRAIDEAILKGWVLVNRTNFYAVANKAKHLFGMNSAVEKGDCILAFISKPIADGIRKAPGEKSSAIIKQQLSKGKDELGKGQSGFYTPKSSVEKEDEGVERGGTLLEGRDF
jgi:hypothetical protein